MADDEPNQRRKVKFLQILLLMDSFEEEDVLRSRERVIWTRSCIRKREERGAYHQLIRKLAVEDASPCRKRFVYAYRCHQNVLLVQMCRLERLHCQQCPPFCLLTWKNADVDWSRDLFRLSRSAFWYNVALKVDGEGVTRTNSDNVRATMLQQFESTSNCCNTLRNKMLR